MTHKFVTSCINALGEDIRELVDMPLRKDLTTRHFIEKIAPKLGIDREVLDMLGYETKKSFADDWAMTCASSYYQGIPCYFVQHSRIEYIFVDAKDYSSVLSMSEAQVRQEKVSNLDTELTDLITERAPGNDKAFYALASDFYKANKSVLDEYRIPLSTFAQYRCDHSKAFALYDRKYYGVEIASEHEPKKDGFETRQW